MIEALGNIGDFVGGFGVIITIIYLAIQIRSNTESNRNNAYQGVVQNISSWTTSVAMDPEITRIINIGAEDRSRLNRDECSQFDLLYTSLFRHYENIHYQYTSRAIGDESWIGWESRIRGTIEPPGIAEVWRDQRLAFSPRFRRFLEEEQSTVETVKVPFGRPGSSGSDDAA